MLKLETPRLILRDYQPKDWERVHLYGSIPEFSQYEVWGPNTERDSQLYVNSMSEQALEKNRYQFDFVVCLKENGLLIGGCGIRKTSIRSPLANLGWAIHPDFQNQGYATEAAQKLIEFGFSDLKLRTIYATCDTRNTASFKVMDKLGMKRVAHLAGDRVIKGHLRDTYRYEISQVD